MSAAADQPQPFHVYLYGAGKGPLPTTFSGTAGRLRTVDRCHFEPDGSFVWVLAEDQTVFGMIYDVADVVQYIDLQGRCDRGQWRRLLGVLLPGSPGQRALPGRPAAGADDAAAAGFMVLQLPGGELKDLHDFEQIWLTGG